VDFLSTYPDTAENRVAPGHLRLGRFALNAAAMDPRIKAVATSTMYDMSRNIANGYFDNGKSAEELRRTRMKTADRSAPSAPATTAKAPIGWPVVSP
jgi:uncharacterized protein